MGSWAEFRCQGLFYLVSYKVIYAIYPFYLFFKDFCSGLLKKRVSLKAITRRSRSDEYKSELVQSFRRDCLNEFEGESPRLVPVVDTVMNLREVVTAHTIMEQNKNTGKIVLTTSGIE